MKIGREEKLVPNLKDKKGYVVHIKALDQALKHGLKLKKVHRVTEFRHSKWMKAYIMLNTKLRKDAKNEFEKDFFKLMNNSVFEKTMENIINHKHMKLVTSEQKYQKYVMKPNFKDALRKRCPYSELFWLGFYSVSLRIQSECGKMQIRITPNTNTFHAVMVIHFPNIYLLWRFEKQRLRWTIQCTLDRQCWT